MADNKKEYKGNGFGLTKATEVVKDQPKSKVIRGTDLRCTIGSTGTSCGGSKAKKGR